MSKRTSTTAAWNLPHHVRTAHQIPRNPVRPDLELQAIRGKSLMIQFLQMHNRPLPRHHRPDGSLHHCNCSNQMQMHSSQMTMAGIIGILRSLQKKPYLAGAQALVHLPIENQQRKAAHAPVSGKGIPTKNSLSSPYHIPLRKYHSSSSDAQAQRSTPKSATSSIFSKNREDIPWPALTKLSPGNLKRTASTLIIEWERSLAPPTPADELVPVASEKGGEGGVGRELHFSPRPLTPVKEKKAD